MRTGPRREHPFPTCSPLPKIDKQNLRHRCCSQPAPTSRQTTQAAGVGVAREHHATSTSWTSTRIYGGTTQLLPPPPHTHTSFPRPHSTINIAINLMYDGVSGYTPDDLISTTVTPAA